MSGSNKVFLKGNIGQDPEMHYTEAGRAICRFTLATNERWKDSNGNRQEHTEWHRIKCFGRLAEVAGEHLSKGSQILAWGKIRTNKFQDREGNNRSIVEIHMDEMEFVGGRQNGAGNDNANGQAQRQNQPPPQQQPPRQSRPAPQPQPQPQPAAAGADQADEFFDDDIPF